MKWPGTLIEAKFLKRYKRFLADFQLPNRQEITAHCANTGSMKTCMEEGAPSWLTHHDNPKRKLKYSWQGIQMPDGWVGINTALANKLVREAIENHVVTPLQGFETILAEQKYGTNSRIDFLLKGKGKPDCFVEVKNVTLLLEEGVAGFPDAVTDRGRKHIGELVEVCGAGHRGVLLFCVQRESAKEVRPAEVFDPLYAQALREAVGKGLEVYAYRAQFSKSEVVLTTPLPVVL